MRLVPRFAIAYSILAMAIGDNVFWTVGKLKSFTKAAEELRIAQSAVSLQVATLEDFLGKKLIIRSTSKKLTLTEEGQIVFSRSARPT